MIWRLALAALIALGLYAPPLAEIAGPFTLHMIRHMALVALIPPLLVAALPWPEALTPGIALAALAEFAVIWTWHAPALHVAAWFDPRIFVLEQASFLLAGLAVWSSALNAREPLAGAGGMLLTTMHMTLLGALLVLAPRALYDYCTLTDQRTGGLLMLAIGTPLYLAGGLRLAARALEPAR